VVLLVIKTAADLLKAFTDAERAKLDGEELTHGPTIGAMYECLTKEIRVVPGFAYFNGELGGELSRHLHSPAQVAT
jgi:hypothetical protein